MGYFDDIDINQLHQNQIEQQRRQEEETRKREDNRVRISQVIPGILKEFSIKASEATSLGLIKSLRIWRRGTPHLRRLLIHPKQGWCFSHHSEQWSDTSGLSIYYLVDQCGQPWTTGWIEWSLGAHNALYCKKVSFYDISGFSATYLQELLIRVLQGNDPYFSNLPPYFRQTTP